MIDLNELKEGLPRLTAAVGASFAEAASVCFEEQNHDKCFDMEVKYNFEDDLKNKRLKVQRLDVSDRMRHTHNETDRTTEDGAYGIAILLILRITDYTITERARKGTGIDYWLGKKDTIPFQNSARLEVSGIRKGEMKDIKKRLKDKKKQIEKSDYQLPGYIVIIEFGKPLSMIVQKRVK